MFVYWQLLWQYLPETFFEGLSVAEIFFEGLSLAEIFFEGLSLAEVTVGLHDSRGLALRASLGQTRNLL